MRFVSQKDYDQWVKDMNYSYEYRSYDNKGNYDGRYKNVCLVFPSDVIRNPTPVIIMNIKTGKTAIASCHKDDTYSKKEGIAIAWARYKNIDIPIKAERISVANLNPGDKFWFCYNYAAHHIFVGTTLINHRQHVLYKDYDNSSIVFNEPINRDPTNAKDLMKVFRAI